MLRTIFPETPSSVVANEVVRALKTGRPTHLFPDPYAKQRINEYVEDVTKNLLQKGDSGDVVLG